MYTTTVITLLAAHVLFIMHESIFHRRGLNLPTNNTQGSAAASDSSIPVLEAPVVDGTQTLLAT